MQIEQRIWASEKGWELTSGPIPGLNADLVIVFANYTLLKSAKHLDEIKNLYPGSVMIGCSTAGEIAGAKVIDNSAVVTAVQFKTSRVSTASINIGAVGNSYEAGAALIKKLDKKGLRHVFVLSEGIKVNGSALVEGINSGLPKGVAVTGGLAGDQALFKETLVVTDGKAKTGMISVLGFYGEKLMIGCGYMGGWDIFGPDRLITKVKGNVLYELDGRPVLELYKTYLGDQAAGLPGTGLLFPLRFRIGDTNKGIVRSLVAVNEKEGSVTLAGDVPEGAYACFMKANMERLIEGAGGAATMIAKIDKVVSPELAILISCVGRKLVLKQRIEEEVEMVKEVFGKNTVMAGFYSYGEICPVLYNKDKGELHNETMTITAFQEE